MDPLRPVDGQPPAAGGHAAAALPPPPTTLAALATLATLARSALDRGVMDAAWAASQAGTPPPRAGGALAAVAAAFDCAHTMFEADVGPAHPHAWVERGGAMMQCALARAGVALAEAPAPPDAPPGTRPYLTGAVTLAVALPPRRPPEGGAEGARPVARGLRVHGARVTVAGGCASVAAEALAGLVAPADDIVIIAVPPAGGGGAQGELAARVLKRADVAAARAAAGRVAAARAAAVAAAARAGLTATRKAAEAMVAGEAPSEAAAAGGAPSEAAPPRALPGPAPPTPADLAAAANHAFDGHPPAPTLTCRVADPALALAVPLDGGGVLPPRNDLPPGALPPGARPQLVGATTVLLVTRHGDVVPAVDGRVDAGGARARAIDLSPALAGALQPGDVVRLARLGDNVLAVRVTRPATERADAAAAAVEAPAAPPPPSRPPPPPKPRPTHASTAYAATVTLLSKLKAAGVAKPRGRGRSGRRRPPPPPRVPPPPRASPPEFMVPFVPGRLPARAEAKRRAAVEAKESAADARVRVSADGRADAVAPPPPPQPPPDDTVAWNELLELARAADGGDGDAGTVVIPITTASDRSAVAVTPSLAALLPRRPGPGRYDVALIDASGVLYTGVDCVAPAGERRLLWGRRGSRLPAKGGAVAVAGDAGSGVLTVRRV